MGAKLHKILVTTIGFCHINIEKCCTLKAFLFLASLKSIKYEKSSMSLRYGGIFCDILGDLLLGLYVGVLSGDIGDAGAGLLGIEIVMTYDQGLWITPMQVFEQPAE